MQFGDYRIEIIPDTEFRLDGGAMFGVVPRNLWSRVAPPDDQNRIRMNTNCLFIESDSERILIETGLGEKWSAKHIAMYGIARERSFADSLKAKTGFGPEEITIVINTHLHFDHAGGNTILNGAGEAVPAFPKARYLLSQAEYEHAEQPSERDRASYFPENWRPAYQHGQVELKPSDYEVVPGLRMETHPGHNRSMQCWRLEQAGRTLFGFADLVPMRAHISLPWIMGYDLYPVETLESKRKLLPEAVKGHWDCLFYHDPEQPLCKLIEENGKVLAVPTN